MAIKSRDERVRVKMLELSLLKAKEAKRKAIEKVKEMTDTVRRAKSSVTKR